MAYLTTLTVADGVRIIHDAPSGKVLRAGDRLFTYDAWGRVKTVASDSSTPPLFR